MGFKVIESDEEFEEALTCKALWVNASAEWPREPKWIPGNRYDKGLWESAPFAKGVSDAEELHYIVREDFSILIEG